MPSATPQIDPGTEHEAKTDQILTDYKRSTPRWAQREKRTDEKEERHREKWQRERETFDERGRGRGMGGVGEGEGESVCK